MRSPLREPALLRGGWSLRSRQNHCDGSAPIPRAWRMWDHPYSRKCRRYEPYIRVTCGFSHQIAQICADRLGESNVRYNAPTEKRMNGALAGSIVELRWQNYIAWRVFFLQTADRRHGNDPANVQGAQRINIRAVIYFVRQNPMATTMSRQKVNLTPTQFSADKCIGWRSKWRVDLVFSRIA